MIGHNEFGMSHKPFYNSYNSKIYKPNSLNYWLEQWIMVYQFIYKQIKDNDRGNIHILSYEKFCDQPTFYSKYFNKLLNMNKIKFTNIKNANKHNIQNFDNQLLKKSIKLYNQFLEISI